MRFLKVAPAFALLLACGEGQPAPDAAQGAATMPSALDDLATDLEVVEQKLVALAEALSEEQYAWRPMEGVRSSGEVFMHVAADNYFLPSLAGVPVPEHTGMTMDYQTVVAFEGTITERDAIIDEMKASFTHLREALAAADPAEAGTELSFFGQTSTLQGLWIQTVAHLHEHLGQAIAYARANEVVPPWSQGN